MKMNNLGIVDSGDTLLKLDIEPTDIISKQELLDENETLKKEIEQEKEKEVERVNNLFISGINAEEQSKATAIEIMEKEKQMQLERELEWKKDKRNKRIKRYTKLGIILFVVGAIAIAWFAGYRIPVSDEFAQHAVGIFDTAKNAIIDFFTTNKGVSING